MSRPFHDDLRAVLKKYKRVGAAQTMAQALRTEDPESFGTDDFFRPGVERRPVDNTSRRDLHAHISKSIKGGLARAVNKQPES